MARSYARITVAISGDPDWRQLSGQAQWLYLMLLVQRKLTLVGALDLKLSVWAEWCHDADPDQLDKALRELVAAGMVAVDWHTQELVIRTFVAHDHVFQNRNLGRGAWSAWQQLESPVLRRVVIDNLPDEAWEPRYEAPMEARVMRHHGD